VKRKYFRVIGAGAACVILLTLFGAYALACSFVYLSPSLPSVEAMRRWLATLEQGLARNDRSVIYGVLRDAVPDFRGEAA